MPGKQAHYLILRLFTGILFLTILTGCARELERTEFLLGTVCTIRIRGGKESDLDAAFRRIRDIENRMSRHIPDNDIDKISSGGPEGEAIDSDTCTIIKRGLDFADLSGGLFDISMAPVVDEWGFGTEEPRVPPDDLLEAALSRVDYRRIRVLEGCRVAVAPGQLLDLGGIAKGYASDEAARLLEESGVPQALINLGGNVYALGKKKNNSPWKIGIQDPLEPTGSSLGILEVSGGAVVTSGIYERFFEKAGRRYHHILDPKTGYPVDNNLAGVTISMSSGMEADALSTTVFLLGIEEGCELLRSFPGSGAVFVTQDREIITFGTASSDFSPIREGYRVTERLLP